MFMFLCFLDSASIFLLARFGHKTDGHILFRSIFFKVFYVFFAYRKGLRHCLCRKKLWSFLTFPTSGVFSVHFYAGCLEAKKPLDLNNFGPFFVKLPKLQDKCLAHTMVNPILVKVTVIMLTRN